MSFLKNLFGALFGSKNKTEKDGKNKKGSYDKTLIKNLTHDHKELFEIYSNIVKYAKKKKWDKILDELENLETEYKTHIYLEDNYFYPYVIKKYQNDNNTVAMIKKKQNEMKEITNILQNFLKKYENEERLKNDYESFITELEAIGNALTERVHFEEANLYVLYKK